jgi:hypothetical protein
MVKRRQGQTISIVLAKVDTARPRSQDVQKYVYNLSQKCPDRCFLVFLFDFDKDQQVPFPQCRQNTASGLTESSPRPKRKMV